MHHVMHHVMPHVMHNVMHHVMQVLTEMIIFVTVSDNVDPYTREGLPHPARQLLLRDQQVQCTM